MNTSSFPYPSLPNHHSYSCGVYNSALIGEMDVAAEKSVDWANIKAEPIPEITFA